MLLARLILLSLTLPTAVDLSLVPKRERDRSESWARLDGLTSPGPRTMDTLKRLDLDAAYKSDAGQVLRRLETYARAEADPDLVYALAEVSWVEGRRQEKWRKSRSVELYVDAVAYSYDFLFDPELAAGRNPADPRYRQAIDLYNAGLERLIDATKSKGGIQPGGVVLLSLHGEEYRIRVALPDTPWGADDVDELIVASAYELEGMPTATRRWGIGVPLIAVRRADAEEKEGLDGFYPAETAFPLTAVLRPRSRLRGNTEDVEGAREVVLDLVDTVKFQTLNDRPDLGIEADLSVPLAYMFSRSGLRRVGLTGFFRPSRTEDQAGLMLLRPYDPGKIPVVMVHGLLSSPLAWVPMLNELQRDPEITSRYQFLLYMYPTGVPVPIAASGLRSELSQIQALVDPDGANRKFDQMVLLGHSMGGLLSHSMVIGSGDRLWYQMSDQPFDSIVGDPDARARLRRYFFFEPLPFVKRVVFLATPHRGSELSRRVVGRLGSGLIEEPDEIERLFKQLARENREAFDPKQFKKLPTSVDNLAPDSPWLTALLEMESAPGVVFHSVIGNSRPGPRDSGTDGIVPFSSAYYERAASTRVVRSDHAVQKDPEAILEVRRILYEHAGLPQNRMEAAAVNDSPPALPPAPRP